MDIIGWILDDDPFPGVPTGGACLSVAERGEGRRTGPSAGMGRARGRCWAERKIKRKRWEKDLGWAEKSWERERFSFSSSLFKTKDPNNSIQI